MRARTEGFRLALDGDEVGTGHLVTVGRAPEHEVGDGTESDGSLDRLVGGTVLTETDRVVGATR